MKKQEKMIIYNLFPLLAGKVNEWETHLDRAADMGFNWIFVNPIQLPGKSGSLYSIKDYFTINSSFIELKGKVNPEDQILAMTRNAKKLGLHMMIDLVISHCSVDSALIKEHPEWFHWDHGGKVAHPFCHENGRKVVWRDLAKLNHGNQKDSEGLFRYCMEIMKYFIGLGFTGFRCDAAYQIPRPFWERLIKETRKMRRGIHFFAETLGCTADQTRETAKAGFNYIFNSSKWWDYCSPWLMAQYNLTREIVPSISFPESHDTGRLCDEIDGNIDGLKQRYLFSALFSSGVMVPMGFEFGFRKKLHVVKTRPEDWEKTDIDISSFIGKVNRLKGSYLIFQEEAPMDVLPYGDPNILILWKGSIRTGEEALLIMNKDKYNRHHFHVENINSFVQAGAPLVDVSPEEQLDYIPEPFSYELLPGQGIVLVTRRDPYE